MYYWACLRIEPRVFLQTLPGYKFNGAVWVGCLAVFGVAVETGL